MYKSFQRIFIIISMPYIVDDNGKTCGDFDFTGTVRNVTKQKKVRKWQGGKGKNKKKGRKGGRKGGGKGGRKGEERKNFWQGGR